MKLCACCSGKIYDMCCRVYLSGAAEPATAEQLMRSRYTAYALCKVDYIIRTTHLTTRGQYDPKAIKQWAASSTWKKLEIISRVKGTALDTVGYVEFKAYYADAEGRECIHHEYSTFKKIDTSWFFLEGKVY